MGLVNALVDDMSLFRTLNLGFNRPTKLYEPKPRYWQYAGAVGGQCFIFAGRTVDFDKSKEELSSTVEVFDQCLEEWQALQTKGRPPKGLLNGGGCCVSPSGELFTYSGYDGTTFYGGLYKLSSLKWRQLSKESDNNSPMKKVGCGMVYFNKNKLAIIGGFGVPLGPPQPGSSFVEDKNFTDGRGWSNEIHLFEVDKG